MSTRNFICWFKDHETEQDGNEYDNYKYGMDDVSEEYVKEYYDNGNDHRNEHQVFVKNKDTNETWLYEVTVEYEPTFSAMPLERVV